MWGIIGHLVMQHMPFRPGSSSSDDASTDQGRCPYTPAFPRDPEDISLAHYYLQLASNPNPLPDELLKLILFHADYDCIHFTSHRYSYPHSATTESCGEQTRPLPYLETAPLRFLSGVSPDEDTPSSRRGSADSPSPSPFKPRIRSVVLRATGAHQGWVEDPAAGSWSWFQVGTRRGGSFSNNKGSGRGWGSWEVNQDVSQLCTPGPNWGWNRIEGGAEWQVHEKVWRAGQAEAEVEMEEWVRNLRDGDRVTVAPMARFQRWQCNVREAWIDVEVEVWG